MSRNLEELVNKYKELARAGCIDEAEELACLFLRENGNYWTAVDELNEALEEAVV